MIQLYRLIIITLLFLATGCDSSPSPFNWPSFDDKVIEAGRPALLAQQNRHYPFFTQPTEKIIKKEVPLPATKKAVLKNLKTWIDVRGKPGRRAIKAIEGLGAQAIEPLLEILADDTIPIRYTERTVFLLIPLGQQPNSENKVTLFSPSANKIFDAVTDYLMLHAEANAYINDLSKITQYDRIPRIIELIESTSGNRQSGYISVFNAVTSNQFPVMSHGYCGNSSRASIDKMTKEGEIRQRESVLAIKAWWETHKKDVPKIRLTSSLREHLQDITQTQGQLFKSIRKGQLDTTQLNLIIRSYPVEELGPYGSSAYEFLLKEFEQANANMKPYLLVMLAMTRHPEAANFIARKLDSDDTNIQHAAISALTKLKVSHYNKTIGRILRTTKDKGVAIEAIDALTKLAGPDAIADYVSVLNHPENRIREMAKQALQGFLLTHTSQIQNLAQTHKIRFVRRTLSTMLQQAKFTSTMRNEEMLTVDFEKRIAEVRAMLRSTDLERQKQGIRLVQSHQLAELLPDVLELIQSQDYNIRDAAISLIQKMGIPGLTVKNAPQLMGFSNSLDEHIAAYCYEKYGSDAVPILKIAAFNLSDPLHASTAPSKPNRGLIEALVKLKVNGIEADVIQFVKDSQYSVRHISLLELLHDAKSAALAGELLKHSDQQIRLAAVNVVRARTLSQFADQIFEMASLTIDKIKIKQLHIQFKNEKLSQQQFNKQHTAQLTIPNEQYRATLTLIDLGDSRSWQAVTTCLNGEHLDWRTQGGVLSGPQVLTHFGIAVSKLKKTHRDDIQSWLLSELAGENRERIIVSLTTALCLKPEEADSQVLWRIASTPHACESAHILSTVALSKLGDRRAIPVLQEIIRAFLSTNAYQNFSGNMQPGFSYVQSQSQQNYPTVRRSTSLDSIRWPYPYRPALHWHHVDLGLALRRLNDTSMTNELVNSLINKRGELNMLAYRFLAGILGRKAYDYARQWIVSNGVSVPQSLNYAAASLLDLEVPVEEVLPLIIEGEGQLPFIAHLLMAHGGSKTAPLLEKAYLDLSNTNDYYKLSILESICRGGDVRGISLAAKNVLHFASITRYLPDAHGVDFPPGHFDYNRIEDAMRVQVWFELHKSDLRWDNDSSQFRLANHPPSREKN